MATQLQLMLVLAFSAKQGMIACCLRNKAHPLFVPHGACSKLNRYTNVKRLTYKEKYLLSSGEWPDRARVYLSGYVKDIECGHEVGEDGG